MGLHISFKRGVKILNTTCLALIISNKTIDFSLDAYDFITDPGCEYNIGGNKYTFRDNIQKDINRNSNMWELTSKDNIDSYNKLISNTTKFIKDTGLNNPAAHMGLYSYMLYNGYLSKNKSFMFANYTSKNYAIPRLNGASIMDGVGNCENISCFFTDILKKENYKAYNIENNFYADSDTTTKEEHKGTSFIIKSLRDSMTFKKNESHINENISQYNGTNVFKHLSFKFNDVNDINHLNTLVFYDGKSILLDPTNVMMFNMKKNEDNTIINEGEPKFDDISFYSGYLTGYLNKKDIGDIYNYLEANKIKDYNNLDIQAGIAWGMNHKEELNNFYKNNKELIISASNLFKKSQLCGYTESLITFYILLGILVEVINTNIELSKEQKKLVRR